MWVVRMAGRCVRTKRAFHLLNVSGYLGMGSDLAASNLDNSQTYQLVDNVTVVKGKHTIKTGFDLRKSVR